MKKIKLILGTLIYVILIGLSSCSKNDNNVAVTGIQLSQQIVTLEKGGVDTLVATISPSDASNKNIIWKSSDESIATVTSNGVVNAIKEGTAIITAQSEDGGFSASCKVVVNVAVTGIKLSQQSVKLEKGASVTLVATISPSNSSNTKIIWKSSDESVATVTSNGVVNALKEGTATITAQSEDGGFSASCDIVVSIAVTGIKLNEQIVTLEKGGAATLVATISPSDASNKNIIWKSSDENVATVSSNGVVNALKEGTTTITVQSEDGGFSASCKVVVNVSVTKLVLSESTLSLTKGQQKKLTVSILPADATNKNVTWTSSNKNIVSVESNGLVSAVKVGKATVTAISENGNKTATCDVEVTSAGNIQYNPYDGKKEW